MPIHETKQKQVFFFFNQTEFHYQKIQIAPPILLLFLSCTLYIHYDMNTTTTENSL